jgi:predicted metalloprotease with PDZ domain
MIARIRYTISLERRQEHLVDVQMTVRGVQGAHLDLVMPVWIPGSYKVRDFARNVQEFDARGLRWRKLDKNTWRVETGGRSTIEVTYAVYAHELTVRNSHVDLDHAYLNGPSIFMYVDGRRAEPHEVRIKSRWEVATGLPRNGAANSYDQLVDCPIEVGTFKRKTFEVLERRHEFVVHGPGNYDLRQITVDAAKIIKQAARVFGELPYDRYVFLLHTSPPSAGTGGLEHSNSCSLQYPPLEFRPPERYERFLNLVSHEFFHLWNVKRIIPANLWPFRYDSESYTELLWVMEGVTSYYSPVLMVRAGLQAPKTFFKGLARKIQTYREKPGRLVQSLAESSFNTWIHLYQPSEQSVNAQISYYEKGELVGLLLDLELRKRGSSLDLVMRRLYREFAAKGRGIAESDMQAVVEDMGGASFRAFFRDYVHGVKELPFESILRGAGLELTRAPVKEEGRTNGARPYLGINLQKLPEKVVVSSVLSGTPAAKAGLSAFDEIVAIDDMKVSPDVWDRQLSERKPGSDITFTLFRNHVLRTVTVRLGKQEQFEYKIAPVSKLSAAQKKVLADWLGRPVSALTKS